MSGIDRQQGTPTAQPWLRVVCVVVLLSSMASLQAQTKSRNAQSAASRIDALPQPAAQPPIDLEALARGYAAQSNAGSVPSGLQRGPGLIVFVSLVMPRPSLERLLDQAERAGASVVLRGFVEGSLRRTVDELQALIGSRRIAVQIDPPAFDRFSVSRVPSFVLVRDGTRPQPCEAGSCAAPTDFLRVSGDVSLDYALAHMRTAEPSFQTEVAVFLGKLER